MNKEQSDNLIALLSSEENLEAGLAILKSLTQGEYEKFRSNCEDILVIHNSKTINYSKGFHIALLLLKVDFFKHNPLLIIYET